MSSCALCLYVTALNRHVNEINEAKLELLDEPLHEISAIVRSSAQKDVNPRTDNGAIINTPLQKVLKVKVGAKVMLTYNVDVIDSLTNGAIGEIVGFQFTANQTIKTILVNFKNEKVGRNLRKNHSFLQQQFNGIPVTPIEKVEYNFSMSKKRTNNQILTALQFPLKLSFACTAHKMQGATVSKPDSLILDLRHVREDAQAYVMLSRVQALNQLFIIEEIEKKILKPNEKKRLKPNDDALKEHARLLSCSLNDIEHRIARMTLITSLNIRSLPKHISDLKSDYKMIGTTMICLQETWCSDNYDNNHLAIDGFDLHLTNQGNGKGIATYFLSRHCRLVDEVNQEKFQMTLFAMNNNIAHFINVYRSHDASTDSFIHYLDLLISQSPNACYIVGDFNIDYLSSSDHIIVTWLVGNEFQQLVHSSTHEEAGLLDHFYYRGPQSHQAHIHWPYYSDHAAICVQKLH